LVIFFRETNCSEKNPYAGIKLIENLLKKDNPCPELLLLQSMEMFALGDVQQAKNALQKYKQALVTI